MPGGSIPQLSQRFRWASKEAGQRSVSGFFYDTVKMLGSWERPFKKVPLSHRILQPPKNPQIRGSRKIFLFRLVWLLAAANVHFPEFYFYSWRDTSAGAERNILFCTSGDFTMSGVWKPEDFSLVSWEWREPFYRQRCIGKRTQFKRCSASGLKRQINLPAQIFNDTPL